MTWPKEKLKGEFKNIFESPHKKKQKTKNKKKNTNHPVSHTPFVFVVILPAVCIIGD